MSKVKWFEYPKNKPKKNGYYLVYIDKAQSNCPDSITACYFERYWDGIIQNYCPVTHFAILPDPPKGTWMAKARQAKQIGDNV